MSAKVNLKKFIWVTTELFSLCSLDRRWMTTGIRVRWCCRSPVSSWNHCLTTTKTTSQTTQSRRSSRTWRTRSSSHPPLQRSVHGKSSRNLYFILSVSEVLFFNFSQMCKFFELLSFEILFTRNIFSFVAEFRHNVLRNLLLIFHLSFSLQVSKACTSLCQWVRAMHKYHFVARNVAPKRAALAESQAELAESQRILDAAKARLYEVEEGIATLQASQDSFRSMLYRIFFWRPYIHVAGDMGFYIIVSLQKYIIDLKNIWFDNRNLSFYGSSSWFSLCAWKKTAWSWNETWIYDLKPNRFVIVVKLKHE